MRDILYFGDINSYKYQMYITGAGVYETPARRFNTVNIKGRNGALILEDDVMATYDNVDIRYPAVIFEDFRVNVKSALSDFSSMVGYHELSDTLEPDRFRMGVFKQIQKFRVSTRRDIGSFELVFNCKPQWYLREGQNPINILSNTELINPTMHYSLPIITVYGNGTVRINNYIITVANNANNYVVVDCETETEFTGSTSRSSDVTLRAGKYPRLGPGVNNITIDGVTVDITPRWYEV